MGKQKTFFSRKITIYAAVALLAASVIFFSTGRRSPYYAEINGKRVTLEIAADSRSRARGLMFRDSLDNNSGMLFIFPEETHLNFWMKDTYIPLDIAFMDTYGVILKTARMVPLDETPVKSGIPATFALEVNQGFFRNYDIKPGDKVTFSEAVMEIRPE